MKRLFLWLFLSGAQELSDGQQNKWIMCSTAGNGCHGRRGDLQLNVFLLYGREERGSDRKKQCVCVCVRERERRTERESVHDVS